MTTTIMAASIEQWCSEELSKLRNSSVNEKIVKHIVSIEKKEDLEKYVFDMFGEFPKVKKFVSELFLKLESKRSQELNQMPLSMQPYMKSSNDGNYIDSINKKSKKKTKGKDKGAENEVELEKIENQVSLPNVDSSSKKKQRYIPLYSQEGQAKDIVQLHGRHPCECQASKHALVNNCLHCGRVVCEQEGSGPCFFCRNLVCTKDEMEVIDRGSKLSTKLYNKLMGFNSNKDSPEKDKQASILEQGLEKAIEHKNRLLEYNQTSARRTHVIDDESDYFSVDSNRWLSKEEREFLQRKQEEFMEQRHASQRSQKITLDFAGRRVIEEKDESYLYDQDIENARDENCSNHTSQYINDFGDRNINPNINGPAPVYYDVCDKNSRQIHPISGSREAKHNVTMRIQDKQLQEMCDEGLCLSMHQPWASLLVKGIKKHEGRTWYTATRGRLWIAATAKQPNPTEISYMEHSYTLLNPAEVFKFPDQYPTACLLGCVDVADCLSQETYRTQFPDGESDSPYVFICENAQELMLKFPIKGKHKIYKLDPKIHQAAKNCLLARIKSI